MNTVFHKNWQQNSPSFLPHTDHLPWPGGHVTSR